MIFPFPNWESSINHFAPPEMVVVAQLVEPQIVVLVVVGSIPIDHPKASKKFEAFLFGEVLNG